MIANDRLALAQHDGKFDVLVTDPECTPQLGNTDV